MQYELSCNQVSALMAFYMEDKLSDKLAQYVQAHLDSCPECRLKYEKIKGMINKFVGVKNTITDGYETQFMTKQYEEFKSNLSAYIDNELNDIDSIKIKKFTISNPLARQDLEDMYSFKKLLHSSFEKTKNEVKSDFSKSIMSELQSKEHRQGVDPFYKIMAIFIIIIACIISGVVGILYF